MFMTDLKCTITTNKWDINLKLFADQTPITVANFVHLIQKWFYNGLDFHRVIEDFMIQTWCPFGTGTGWPWYNFADEFHDDLKHDKPGILSMANSWPWTNGSQFFITHTATPWLDWNHTVFGEIIWDVDKEIVDGIEQWDEITNIKVTGDIESFLKDHKDRISQRTEAMSS